MSYNHLPLDRSHTSFIQIKDLFALNQQVSITADAHQSILKCRDYLEGKMKEVDHLFYGINTGFGFLQNVRINQHDLTLLQENLLKSHACGLGEEVPIDIVKLMMALKIKSLSYGHSGVQIDTVNRLSPGPRLAHGSAFAVVNVRMSVFGSTLGVCQIVPPPCCHSVLFGQVPEPMSPGVGIV